MATRRHRHLSTSVTFVSTGTGCGVEVEGEVEVARRPGTPRAVELQMADGYPQALGVAV